MTFIFDMGFASPEDIARIDADLGVSFIGVLSPYDHPDLSRIPFEDYENIGVSDEGDESPQDYRTSLAL